MRLTKIAYEAAVENELNGASVLETLRIEAELQRADVADQCFEVLSNWTLQQLGVFEKPQAEPESAQEPESPDEDDRSEEHF